MCMCFTDALSSFQKPVKKSFGKLALHDKNKNKINNLNNNKMPFRLTQQIKLNTKNLYNKCFQNCKVIPSTECLNHFF